jgi:hypothetical protein
MGYDIGTKADAVLDYADECCPDHTQWLATVVALMPLRAQMRFVRRWFKYWREAVTEVTDAEGRKKLVFKTA